MIPRPMSLLRPDIACTSCWLDGRDSQEGPPGHAPTVGAAQFGCGNLTRRLDRRRRPTYALVTKRRNVRCPLVGASEGIEAARVWVTRGSLPIGSSLSRTWSAVVHLLGRARRRIARAGTRPPLARLEQAYRLGITSRQPWSPRAPVRARSSSTVSSAVGTASRRASEIGRPLSIDRPYVPAARRCSARSRAATCA